MPVGRIDPDKAILGNLIKRMSKRNDPLTPLIDRYLLTRNLPGATRLRSVTLPLVERSRPGGRISPSSMGGCQRAAVFKFTGLRGTKRLDPQSEAIFDDGNWRHHRWQTIFRDMEKVLGRETFRVISIEEKVVIEDLYMSGHLDVTIWIKGIGRIVVDIKGINDRGFTMILTTDEPIAKHVEQLMAYCEARHVYKGLLFYENKNDNRWRCYLIKWDGAKWEKVQGWADEVLTALENEELPDRDVECNAGTYLYDRCPYSKWCYGGKDHDEIKAATYRNFPGVEVAWRRGHDDED